ncbi:NitT/TauT family transport system permease protein [Rhodobacter sp. 140A]|uniref:Putative aliphatic sulfonates transport permease protein SsuC n=2 Tax=root TaxID=1 RepID=A0A644WKV2_9ZZZZ|nr:NitT/TauT family transport system permease protein [Rhodobacter sp. 140A]
MMAKQSNAEKQDWTARAGDGARRPRPEGKAPGRAWLVVRQPIGPASYWLLALAGLATPFVIWTLVASTGLVGPRFLPAPMDVALRGWDWLGNGGLAGDALISIFRVFSGFLLAVLLAVPLGVLIGTFRPFEAFFEPVNDFFRYMPTPAFIPLVMIWIGIGEGAKITIIFLGTFFQMVVMIADNVRQVPLAQIEAAQTMGAARRELISQVLVPSALPAMSDTLRVTMGWAWTYLVVAELIASSSGLGFQIMRAQRFMQTDKIFMGILVIGLLGIAFDQIARFAQRRLFPWWSRK